MSTPNIDELIDKGPTESTTDTPKAPPPGAVPPDSAVLPLSKSSDPAVADKPFNPNDFNKIKGEPEEPVVKQKEGAKPDDKLAAEEKAAAEREAKLAEQEKALKDQKAKDEPPAPKKDEPPAKDKLPFKPLKDIAKGKEGTESQDKQGERDFAGFDENEIGLLKRMSNEAYQFVRPRLLAEKELKGKVKELESNLVKAKENSLPESYYEHPQAYVLDKNYVQAAENVNTVMQEMRAWEEALMKCKAGEEWIEYQFDNKNQRYVPIKHAASPRAELYIETAMHRGRQILNDEETSMKSIISEHENRSSKLKSIVKEREDNVFPQYSSEDIIKTDPAMKSLADYLSAGGLGNNVLLSTCCKFYAHALKLQDKLDEIEAGSKKDKTIAEVRKDNGPSNTEINTGVQSAGKGEAKDWKDQPFSWDAYAKLKGEQ
jgi:hypothetical protein